MRLVSFDATAGVISEAALVASATPAAAALAATTVATTRTGVIVNDEVVDLCDPVIGLPADMTQLLEVGEPAIQAARVAVTTKARRFALADVRLRAPILCPPKVLAIGMNYRQHVAELGREAPEFQYWFNKQRTCVIGPGQAVVVPSVSDQVDYEGELAVIIGRRCRNIPAVRALDVVAGFSVINDVSVRDWQARTPTFTMGKSFDTHGPLGPWIATPDEVGGDPSDLAIRTWVNDEIRQDSTTAELIFSVEQMIEYLTSAFTLEPGDVLATGTPSGVAMGMNPPRWLKAGDTVRIEIEGIGKLENPVVAEGRPETIGLE